MGQSDNRQHQLERAPGRTPLLLLPHTNMLENCGAGQQADALILIIGYYHPFMQKLTERDILCEQNNQLPKEFAHVQNLYFKHC